MVKHSCNPRTQEDETGGLRVQVSLDYLERPCLKKTIKKKKKRKERKLPEINR
jgi:hypothetical protein